MVCGQNNHIIIIILNIVIIGILLIFLIKQYKKKVIPEKLFICMIIGGGLSNLIDRIFRGYVVDYIDINQIIKYPIFNIADISIVIGVILFIVYMIIKIIRKQENA